MRLLAPSFPGQFRKKPLLIFGGMILFFIAAYQLAGIVIGGDTQGLMFLAVAIVIGASILSMLNNWRLGTLIFFGWLFFEDLARRYLGDNRVVYFGKDALVLGVLYRLPSRSVVPQEASVKAPEAAPIRIPRMA
jgi:hypothetical protein